MFKRVCVLFILTAIVSGCAHYKHRPTAPAQRLPPTSSTQYRQISTFTEINIQGHVNATLHTGFKKPQVVLTGDPRDLAQVSVEVKNSELYVVLGGGYPKFGSVHADIRGQSLDSIRYTGAGYLTGMQLNTRFLSLYLANQGTTKFAGNIGLQTLHVTGSGLTQISGISSHNLDIQLKGNPKVQLTGMASLSKLNINGNGWLSLYWVNSDTLTVTAKKKAKIQLAGIANRLEVELWDAAEFKGRYLRAQRSFVKTHNHATAEISAIKHQSTLASNASNIYYYNISDTRADFMAYNGSVLDMREWSIKDQEDFTRYNKQFP